MQLSQRVRCGRRPADLVRGEVDFAGEVRRLPVPPVDHDDGTNMPFGPGEMLMSCPFRIFVTGHVRVEFQLRLLAPGGGRCNCGRGCGRTRERERAREHDCAVATAARARRIIWSPGAFRRRPICHPPSSSPQGKWRRRRRARQGATRVPDDFDAGAHDFWDTWILTLAGRRRLS